MKLFVTIVIGFSSTPNWRHFVNHLKTGQQTMRQHLSQTGSQFSKVLFYAFFWFFLQPVWVSNRGTWPFSATSLNETNRGVKNCCSTQKSLLPKGRFGIFRTIIVVSGNKIATCHSHRFLHSRNLLQQLKHWGITICNNVWYIFIWQHANLHSASFGGSNPVLLSTFRSVATRRFPHEWNLNKLTKQHVAVSLSDINMPCYCLSYYHDLSSLIIPFRPS